MFTFSKKFFDLSVETLDRIRCACIAGRCIEDLPVDEFTGEPLFGEVVSEAGNADFSPFRRDRIPFLDEFIAICEV